ncbi:MAG: RluA family pseudouridine synthase [Chloroflexi bacterium]|nr:RluA family pseudouridine synthase [Chloroflexota bacterium]
MTFDLSILFIDDHLLVVNKPAGLPTLPDGYDKSAPCLINLVKQQYRRVWVVHRLDKDTSGAIVFARSAEVHRALNIAFDSHEVSKVYHAITIGVPAWDEHTIDLPLRPDSDRRHRTVVDRQRGKPAVTRVCVIECFAQHALIEARPETGRTHQIRAHLAAIDLPLAGDVLYGGKDATVLLSHTALHAQSIELDHPATHQRLHVEAPYPLDLTELLDRLRGQ